MLFDKFALQFFAENDATNLDNGKEGDNKTEKTFSQAELDKAIKERLERERKKYADYEDLKKAKSELDEIKRGKMTEIDKLKADLETAKAESVSLTAQINEMNLNNMKSKIASEMGIPSEFAVRLSGNTEEEVRADAEKLKPLFKAKGAVGGAGVHSGGKNLASDTDAGAYGKTLAQSVLNRTKKAEHGFFKR